MSNKQEEVADLINYEVRYVEDLVMAIGRRWSVSFFSNPFNINNHLMFSHVYLGSILNSPSF